MTDSTHDIVIPFDDPFYVGGPLEAEDLSTPVSIDGRGYLLDTENPQGLLFQRRSVQLLNTQDARSGQDQSSTAPEVWRRTQDSWHQGADQARFDRDESLPFRYHSSVGMDPWKRYGIEMLHDVDTLQTLGNNVVARMESIGTILFVATGSTVRVYPDPVNAPGTYLDHPVSGAIADTTADGEHFYALCATGTIHQYTVTGATWNDVWATVASPVVGRQMIAFAKGFILVGNGRELWNYQVPGTPVSVFIHPLLGWTWRSACEGLSVIYVLGGMGDRWHVHRVGIKTTGAALDPPIVAASLPEGEFAYSLASYLGYVLIGVNAGFRFGMPDGQGNITYGQLVETPSPVRCFEGQDRFVWFGLSITQAQVGKAVVEDRSVYTDFAGLGRMDLSTFVAPMTPAAASDLYGQAYGETYDVVSLGGPNDGFGVRAFSVTSPTGGKVLIEATRLVPTAWFTQGVLTFNTNDEKVGLYAQVYHEPLHGSVRVRVGKDRGDVTFSQVGFNDVQNSVSVGNMAFPQNFSAVELRVEVTRDATDNTKGPRISRTEFRALPVPGRSTEWRIPLFVMQDLNYTNIERTRDVRSDYDYLVNLVQTRKVFLYREGDRYWRLYALDFTWMPYKMTSDRATYQGTFLLIARETT